MKIGALHPNVELQVGWQTTTLRKRPRVFGTQSTFDAALAVASQVAGRTIVFGVVGGPKQHVQGRFITLFIVSAEAGPEGALLGVGDILVHCTSSTTLRTSNTRA